jgi:hypothetical protein
MAFVIPSGNVPMEAKVFLGLHRSKWADIHVTLSLIMLGLIAWHIRLSWDRAAGYGMPKSSSASGGKIQSKISPDFFA